MVFITMPMLITKLTIHFANLDDHIPFSYNFYDNTKDDELIVQGTMNHRWLTINVQTMHLMSSFGFYTVYLGIRDGNVNITMVVACLSPSYLYWIDISREKYRK